MQNDVLVGVKLSGVAHSVILTSVSMSSRLGRPTRLGIASTRRVANASMPTRAKISGAYVSSALAVDECTVRGYDDALLLTSEVLLKHRPATLFSGEVMLLSLPR